MKTGDIELSPDEFKDGYVKLSVYERLRAENENLANRIEGQRRTTIKEIDIFRGLLREARDRIANAACLSDGELEKDNSLLERIDAALGEKKE